MSSKCFRTFGQLAATLLLLGAGLARADAGADVAMVTLLQGGVSRAAPLGPQPIQPFTKLKHGDLLILDKAARLQVVYFDNGRQESWAGGGRLEIAKAESTPYGLPPAEVKVLPAVMVKQIAKTPALDSQGRAGMMRLRAVSTPEDVARIEETYKRMRMEAVRGDLNPEMYLLSSLFELKELDRLEQALAEMQQRHPGSADAAVLASLYNRAAKNAREAKGK